MNRIRSLQRWTGPLLVLALLLLPQALAAAQEEATDAAVNSAPAVPDELRPEEHSATALSDINQAILENALLRSTLRDEISQGASEDQVVRLERELVLLKTREISSCSGSSRSQQESMRPISRTKRKRRSISRPS